VRIRISILAAAIVLAAAGSPAAAQEVVVLKGGTRIALKKPWVRQGNLALLTRSDGALLSVPVSEIDAQATRAAREAARAPKPEPAAPAEAATPVEAARAAQEAPKARVRITDADVAHEYVPETAPAAPGEAASQNAPPAAAESRLYVSGFTQESGDGVLMVKGTLQNGGAGRAVNTRLTVTALDADGKELGSTEASLSKGSLDGGENVEFAASVPVGREGPPAVSVKFTPQWIGGPPTPVFPAALPPASPPRS
jgi:hypothetical protein